MLFSDFKIFVLFTAISIHKNDANIFSNSVQLNLFIKPFANCTTVVYIFTGTKISLTETTPPIIVLSEETNTINTTSLERSGFLRKRNPSKYCRAFFIVQPETSQYFFSESNKTFPQYTTILYIVLHHFIYLMGNFGPPHYSRPQFSVCIFSISQKMFKATLEEVVDSYFHFNQNLITVNFSFEEDNKNGSSDMKGLEFYCFNHYHGNMSQKWFYIPCNVEEEFDCFQKIDNVTTMISFLQKYFWYNKEKKKRSDK